MAVTTLNDGDGSVSPRASKTKIISIIFLFLLSLLAFVCQTEFTSRAYTVGFKEPIALLLVTHGMWWIIWPIQVILIAVFRTGHRLMYQRRLGEYEPVNSPGQIHDPNLLVTKPVNVYKYFKKSIVKQVHNVYHTSILIYEANVNGDTRTEQINQLIDLNPHISNTSSLRACFKSALGTPSIKYVLTKSAIITMVLTIAGFSWYGAMLMTYASDVTAIYNCLAFTAYAFAIPILKERFSWLKVSSVVIAIAGVFIVAYSGDAADGDNPYPYRFWGNLIILAGAVLYGYYEVLYKKYTCIPAHLATIITPRRQLTFSNFIMALFGTFTFLFLFTSMALVHIFHIHHFNLFDYGDKTGLIWFYIIGSLISNILFSAAFLSLMALTNPVLSSVSSLTTIFLIGLTEWVLFGIKLSFQQLLGDMFVIAGFVLLTAASWKEISEGNDDDDVENVSTFSFPVSTDGTI